MNSPPLEELDLTWLAEDEQGFAAAFITAGAGPIPESAIPHALQDDPSLEESVARSPMHCEVALLVSVPNASSYIALGSRGLPVYDWWDIHRTCSESTGEYELVCQPAKPIRSEALPPLLRAAAEATVLPVSFTELTRVRVRHGT